MTDDPGHRQSSADNAPGDGGGARAYVRGYVVGIVLATILTVALFVVARSTAIWSPGVPAALIALAVAQIGVHLVFFLHIGTGPDDINNALALAFGVLIVTLVVGGSLWIMANLNRTMQPGDMKLDAEMQAPPPPPSSGVDR